MFHRIFNLSGKYITFVAKNRAIVEDFNDAQAGGYLVALMYDLIVYHDQISVLFIMEIAANIHRRQI